MSHIELNSLEYLLRHVNVCHILQKVASPVRVERGTNQCLKKMRPCGQLTALST